MTADIVGWYMGVVIGNAVLFVVLLIVVLWFDKPNKRR